VGSRALVTGAFGFVGGHLCRDLLAVGAHVVATDLDTAVTRPSLINRQGLRRSLRVLPCDLGREDCIAELSAEPTFDVVFHLAACAIIEKAADRPCDSIRTNAMGIVHLMEALRVASDRERRAMPTVVLASTDKVYGEMNGAPYREHSPLWGVGFYEAGKLAADVFAQTYQRVFRWPMVVLRLCNLFGPGDFNTDHRVIPRALRRLFEMPEPQPPILYADAVNHRRDYLYIDDAIRALLLLGIHAQSPGQIFNVGAASEWATPALLDTVIDTAARLEEAYDCRRAVAIRENGVLIQAGHPHVQAVKRQHLDSRKIRDVVGFEPRVSFAQGLEDTIRFYRAYFSERW
jgi:nucleoside-diphosphate-sugar epimerase